MIQMLAPFAPITRTGIRSPHRGLAPVAGFRDVVTRVAARTTAATRIARGLAAEGFGVLRVDFTGSGEGCERRDCGPQSRDGSSG